MSWRSARVSYGLDEPGREFEGPHEAWSRYAWRTANLGTGLLAAALFAAIATGVIDALVGYRLPYLSGFLQIIGGSAFVALAAVVVVMRVGDGLDRRAAWRDDALQARLPLGHHLRRPQHDHRPADPHTPQTG